MAEILRNGRWFAVSRADARRFAKNLGNSFPPSWTMERASMEFRKRVRGSGAPACRDYGMSVFRSRRHAYLKAGKGRRRYWGF